MRKRFLNNLGYGLAEVLLVASIVGVVPITIYLEAEKSARSVDCISNLRNVYIAIELYQSDFERVPDIKFYPESAQDDPKSIINVLGRYIDDKKVFLCPSMPDELKKRGLTYLWNDSYNNKFLDNIEGRTSKWLMTEISAVDPKIPPPHRGSYNVLFLDGHAEGHKGGIDIAPMPTKLKDEINIFFAGMGDRKFASFITGFVKRLILIFPDLVPGAKG